MIESDGPVSLFIVTSIWGSSVPIKIDHLNAEHDKGSCWMCLEIQSHFMDFGLSWF